MIYINNLEVMRGNNTLLNNACATIYPHKRVGLIGRNGCGKSTLFALIKKEILPENGDINIPSSWVISSVAQETPGLEESALDYVIDGDKQYRALEKELKAAEKANDGMKAASLHMELENIQAYTINSRAGRLLLGLGFSTADFTKPTKEFSGGWRMRLNLAQALICRSDLLLLDEPTNHLDLDTVMWLEDWLKAYHGTLIIISHDRDFLDNICTNIIHIEHKKLNCYTGNYTDFEVERAQRLALEKAMYDKQQTELAHMQAFVDKFRYKATKAKQAQSRLKAMERMEKIVLAQADSPFSFSFFIKNSIFNGTVADIVKYSPFCSSLSTSGFSLPSVPLKLGKFLSLSGPHSPIPPSNSTLLLPPLLGRGVFGAVVELPAPPVPVLPPLLLGG